MKSSIILIRICRRSVYIDIRHGKFFCTSRLTRLTSVCEYIFMSNFWCSDCTQLEILKAKLFNRYFLFKFISSISFIQFSAKKYRPSRLTRHLHVAAEIWNFTFSHFILIYRLFLIHRRREFGLKITSWWLSFYTHSSTCSSVNE
jgi:hypothetical protein